ncbi:acyl- dehydrogenase medium-chain specific mitochondrial precursor [Fusarium albosuccineum]|uniref:Acyl- dehydrogenase medium-chain specific mitochondrial n=1 Tax=Fusarium albosuccineum TaxID=1237068 RepID=A0A8H4P9J1_9HYPO|nr:acyl- dehydrogenase medium-chain specific mitochondrial precursor [Fusarium albosuccineum]
MEAIYDSRAWQLPAATTGGSASIFDGQQAVFLDEISCADAVAFAKAADHAGALVPRTPTNWRFKCTGDCKSPPDSCLRHLLEYASQLKTAAEGRTTAKASIPTTPGALFPVISMQAKIYATDCAVDCVVDAMKAVGMKSYAKDVSFPRLLNEAMCYPLFDGGNIGLRRRQMQRLMIEEDYEPWAATYGATVKEKGRL